MLAIAPSIRVLIVEDDDDTAKSTSLSFRTLGCNAETDSSGELALEISPVFPSDLMLIDSAMPKLDGCELANQFRHSPSVVSAPPIANSSFVDRKHRQQALDSGFDGFVSKPFTTANLQDLCHRVRVTRAYAAAAIENANAAAMRAAAARRKCRAMLGDLWLNRRVRE